MDTPIGQPPKLEWRAGDIPHAPAYDDGYFGSRNALHEVAHVFLNGTGLWQALLTAPRDRPLQIGETGFGTGLNFCAAVQLWLACKKAGIDVPPLHFTSVEAWPLDKPALTKALAVFPSIANVAQPLIAAWPDRFLKGQLFSHSFFDGQVRLSLKIDKAAEGLAHITVPGGIDIWFLDGFAPDRNPEMWSDDVFAQLNRLSAPGAKLSTFTSAGFVRRGLSDAGFDVHRAKGFGRKRHMIVAEFAKRRVRPNAPYVPVGTVKAGPRVAIIGGGIAGHLLAERARHYTPNGSITIFDPTFDGSNAPPKVTMVPRLDVGQAAHNWLMPRLFHFAADYWQALGPGVFQQIGAHYLPPGEKQAARAEAALSDFGGQQKEDGSIHWPAAGVIDRDAAFAALRAQSGAALKVQEITTLKQLAGNFDHIILANGAGAAAALPHDIFPATGRAGTVCRFPVINPPAEIRFGDGHVIPAGADSVWAGASFHHWKLSGARPDLPKADEELCAEKVHWALGETPSAASETWHGLRVVLPDQLPMAGRLPNWQRLAEAIAGLRHGQWLDEGAMQAAFPNAFPAVHILAGAGARGFMWLPFLADHVIRGAFGLTLDSGMAASQALAPWRFLLRAERYSRLENPNQLPNGPVSADFA